MDQATLTALKESIDSWKKKKERVIATGLMSLGSDSCPLCQLFYLSEVTCSGCPVKLTTNKAQCKGTPYQDVSILYGKYRKEREEREAHSKSSMGKLLCAIDAEIQFLESLVPVLKTPPSQPSHPNCQCAMEPIARNDSGSLTIEEPDKERQQQTKEALLAALKNLETRYERLVEQYDIQTKDLEHIRKLHASQAGIILSHQRELKELRQRNRELESQKDDMLRQLRIEDFELLKTYVMSQGTGDKKAP